MACGLWLVLPPSSGERGCLAPKQGNVETQQGKGSRGLQEGGGLQPLLQGTEWGRERKEKSPRRRR